VKFTIESWDSDYGAPADSDLADASAEVDVSVELPADRWRPQAVDAEPATEVLFIDGVRRVDATVWIEQPPDFPAYSLAATYAAGAVRCNQRATLETTEVERGLFTATGAQDVDTSVGTYRVKTTRGTTAEQLWLGIQQRLADLESAVARQAGDAELVVVDGPLSHSRDVPDAVGYIKSQRVQYLPLELREVLSGLPVGSRTPLFLTSQNWSRFSWYMRLAAASGPAGGLVRCELSADQPAADAIRAAGRVTATLPRYASALHKDPRAPQNLYPIGGLERELRRRLGDRDLAVRALRRAAAA
jgi:hypothetical protein